MNAVSYTHLALLLPNRTDVISVSISCDDERETITDKREIDDLFANLSTVRIKSGESYSDSPTTDKFNISTNRAISGLFRPSFTQLL